MKLAILQPYLFPYLGYFQLIREVDVFVVYDDVNFIKGGWINRNYILTNGDRHLISLPLQGASQNKFIKQVEVGGKHKILQSLQHSYGKAPYFDAVYPLIKNILMQREKNLALFLDYQLRKICDYLDLRPKWYISSMLKKDNQLRSQEKILSICKELGASHYINAIGGKDLYDPRLFNMNRIKLSFIQPRVIRYPQFKNDFVPNLSILDMLMFNDQKKCSRLLEEYDLV